MRQSSALADANRTIARALSPLTSATFEHVKGHFDERINQRPRLQVRQSRKKIKEEQGLCK